MRSSVDLSAETARRVGLAAVFASGAVVLALVVDRHYALGEWLFFRYARAVLLAGVFAVSCLAAGHAVLVRTLRRTLPLAEHAAVAFAIGVFCFFLTSFAAGVAGLYGAPFFFLGPLVLLASGGRALWTTLQRLRRHLARREVRWRPTPVRVLAFALGAIGVALVWLSILTPDNASYDARWYHLPIAEHYVAAGRIEAFREGWVNGAQPHLASYLYAWAFSAPFGTLFDRVELAAHVELVIFLGTLAAIPPLCARVLGERRAPLAWTALFLFPGIHCYDSGLVLGADHVAAVWAAPAFLLLLRAWPASSTRLSFLLAIPVAGLLCTKLTAAALVPFPVLALASRCAWQALRSRSRRPLVGLALMATSVVVLTAPHWATNLVFHGDPAFPLLRRWLPSHPWSALAEASYAAELTLRRPSFDLGGLRDMVRTLATFSFVPHDYAVYHGTIPVFGSLFTLATPALALLGKRPRLWALFACAYAAVACWFWLHQLDRYLQPVVPLMAASTAAVLVLAWREGALVRVAAAAMVGLQVVWGADVAVMASHQTGGGVVLKTVIDLLGSGHRKDHAGRRPFAPFGDIAAVLPKGAKVLVHEQDVHVGLAARTAQDFPGFQGAFYWGARGAESPREAWELLRAHRVTHLLWHSRVDQGVGSIASALVFHELVGHHASLVGEYPPFSLAALGDTPPAPTPPGLVAFYPCPGGPVARGLYRLSDLTDAPLVERARDGTVAAAPRRAAFEEGPPLRTIPRARYLVLEDRCNAPLSDLGAVDFDLLAMRGEMKLFVRRAGPLPSRPIASGAETALQRRGGRSRLGVPMAPNVPFSEAMSSQLLVFDGAMGSLLYERGIFVTQNFEQLNVARPDVVRKIHADYVAAGAHVILTNTFGANAVRLERHGLVGEVRSFNLAGAKIAREEAGDTAYVAGSIGPTGLVPGVVSKAELAAARKTFAEQAAALAEGGVDLFVMETFRHLDELQLAVEAAREGAPGIPIIASVTFDAEGTVADGSEPEAVARRVADLGIAAIGVNCGDGPQLSLSMAERMRGPGLPVCVMPNAGLPRTVDGRLLYMATPEYFDVFARRMLQAGATMIGGCCGTTPEHVKWMAKSVRMYGKTNAPRVEPVASRAHDVGVGLPPTPIAERSPFAAKVAAGKFVVSVEVNPAPGVNPDVALTAAKMLIDNGVDVVNVADGPRAVARMSNLAFCMMLVQRHGIEPLIHVCGRDRNLLAQMAHLLGAHAVGLRNLVVITGDPPKVGDYPEATAVYDLDAIGLLHMASSMNRGIDPAGKALPGGKTAFFCATGLEPGAADLDREIKRLEQKRAAGADIVMTQPIFQQEVLDEVLKRIAHLDMPVMIGVLPLVSYKNAEFLHNEVPGMQIPEHIRERMRGVPAGPEARKEGVKIAREMLFSVRDRVQGAYLMPPLGKYELALEVLDGLKR